MATIGSKPTIKVKVSSSGDLSPTSSPITLKNAVSTNRLDSLVDVNPAGEANGAVPVYDSSTDTYIVRQLEYGDLGSNGGVSLNYANAEVHHVVGYDAAANTFTNKPLLGTNNEITVSSNNTSLVIGIPDDVDLANATVQMLTANDALLSNATIAFANISNAALTNMWANTANVDALQVNTANVLLMTANAANIANAQFDYTHTTLANVGVVHAQYANVVDASIDSLNATNVTVGNINISLVSANLATANTLTVYNTATIANSALLYNDTSVAGATYTNKTFSVSAQEGTSTGLFFKPDGTSMYVVGQSGDAVQQYTLATAWDITTATYTQNFSVLAQDTATTDLFFSPDGLKMYVAADTLNAVLEYTLGTAWNVTTATYTQQFSIASQEGSISGIFFKADGTKMYIVGSGSDAVFQYTLSTPWNTSTAVYDNKSAAIVTQDTTSSAMWISTDGLTMYMLGSSTDSIYQYALATPWDVSTATYTGYNVYVGHVEQSPGEMFINESLGKLWVGGTTSDAIREFAFVPAAKITANTYIVDAQIAKFPNTLVANTAYIIGSGLTVYNNTTLGTTAIGGTLTATSTVTLSGTTTSTTTIGTSATTGTLAIGGTTQTGSITFGQATTSSTTNIATGAANATATKTVNIGTAGVSGSITNITLGSAVAGATGNTVVNSLNFLVGANVIANTTALFVGNSTVNTVITNGQLKIANATNIANVGPLGLTVGIVTANATQLSVGANVYANATTLFVGNAVNQTVISNLGATFAQGNTGQVSVSNDSNGSIELGQAGRTTVGTPFIDFHSSVNNIDYDTRIIASGGNTTVGSGNLQIVASILNVSNTVITGTANASVGFNVGANVAITTSSYFVGNSTANSTRTATSLTVANSTNTATLTPISLTIGSTVVNTSAISFSGTMASGNTTITGFANVVGNVQVSDTITGNNMTLTGNLTVSGTTTYINTTNLNVGDNIITLNADVTGSTTPTENAGFEVNRGNSANVSILWNETNKNWAFNTGGTADQFKIASTANAVNYVQIAGANTTTPYVSMTAQGTDTNVGMNINSKGSFDLILNGGSTGWVSLNPGSVRQFAARNIASAVNYLTVWGSAAGSNNTTLSATYSTDTNVDVTVASKAAGSIYLQTQGLATGGTTQVKVVDTASAVNYIQLSGAATTGAPYILANGSDTDVPLVVSSKNAGSVLVKTAGSGPTQLAVTHTASAVNYIQVTGAATGTNPTISVQGSDTNRSLALQTKGDAYLYVTSSTGYTHFRVYSPSVIATSNYLQVTGAATGSGPILSAQGSDANVDITIVSKGTANVNFQTGSGTGFRVADSGGSDFWTVKAGTGTPGLYLTGSSTNINGAITTKGTGYIGFSTNTFNQEQVRITHTASAVNYLQLTGGATGSGPTISAQGSDANVALNIAAKASANVNINSNTNFAANTLTFTGTTGSNTSIALRVLNDGVLSFEGGAGQLFSIANNLTGQIFAVNDISGIPSIEVYSNGQVNIARFGGNTTIGTAAATTTMNGTIVFTGNTTLSGNVGYSGQLTLTAGANAILFTNATSNYIAWNSAGVASPSVSTRSAGTKLVLYPNVAADKVDFAIGIENEAMWSSVATSSQNFKWYANTNTIMVANATALTVNANASVAGNATISGTSFAVPNQANVSFVANNTTGDFKIYRDNINGAQYLAISEGAGGHTITAVSTNTNQKPLILNVTGGGNTAYDFGVQLAVEGATKVAANSTSVRIGTANFDSTSGNTTLGNTTITGNLTVTGTTTYVNTTNLNVGDNIITLNADLGAVAPTENSGIEVNRGTSANVSFLWDETNDVWASQINSTTKLSVSNATIATTGNTYLFLGAYNNEGGELAFANTTGGTGPIIDVDGGNNLRFNTYSDTSNYVFNTGASPTSKVTIAANGNVGIGTATPAEKLVIQGAAARIQTDDASTKFTILNGGNNTTGRFPQLVIQHYSGNTTAGDSGGQPVVELIHARGNTSAPLAVASGDILGGFNTWGSNGSINQSATRIQGIAEANFTTTATAGLQFFTTNAGTQAERVRMAANGNVGIGVTTPDMPLVVSGTVKISNTVAGGLLLTSNNGSNGYRIRANVSDAAQYEFKLEDMTGQDLLNIQSGSSGFHELLIDNVVKAKLVANGNFGIGNTTPGHNLRVEGTTSLSGVTQLWHGGTGFYTSFDNSNEINMYTSAGANTTMSIQYRSGDTNIGNGQLNISRRTSGTGTTFAANNNVGIGNTTPAHTLRVEGTVSHLGLSPSTGTNIDQIYTATPSLTLNTTWQSTGVTSTNLANGSYIVQVFANDVAAGGTANNEYYTGMMSWYSADTNSTVIDEIPLHRAGVSGSNNSIFLATQRTATANTSDLILMMSSAANNSGASTYTLKFRRMI